MSREAEEATNALRLAGLFDRVAAAEPFAASAGPARDEVFGALCELAMLSDAAPWLEALRRGNMASALGQRIAEGLIAYPPASAGWLRFWERIAAAALGFRLTAPEPPDLAALDTLDRLDRLDDLFEKDPWPPYRLLRLLRTPEPSVSPPDESVIEVAPEAPADPWDLFFQAAEGDPHGLALAGDAQATRDRIGSGDEAETAWLDFIRLAKEQGTAWDQISPGTFAALNRVAEASGVAFLPAGDWPPAEGRPAFGPADEIGAVRVRRLGLRANGRDHKPIVERVVAEPPPHFDELGRALASLPDGPRKVWANDLKGVWPQAAAEGRLETAVLDSYERLYSEIDAGLAPEASGRIAEAFHGLLWDGFGLRPQVPQSLDGTDAVEVRRQRLGGSRIEKVVRPALIDRAGRPRLRAVVDCE